MAKKDTQDFRVDFIEAIGRTENLRVLRNISSNMTRYSYTFNLNNAELTSILELGVKEIRKLLGSSANSFLPLAKIKETSPQTYFEKIANGYKEIESKQRNIIELDKKVQDLESRISKCKEKGKLDKLKEYELKLAAINYPNETITKIEVFMSELDNRLQEGMIDVEDYISIKKNYDRLRKSANETIKIRNGIRDTDNIVFLNKMQEEVRHFLCYLFFERTGKMSESPNRFLSCFDGEAKIDFEHLLLLYSYLKSIKYSNIKEVEGVLYYFALEQFYRDVSPFLLKREFIGINLKDSPTEFYSEKYQGYTRKYISAFLLPDGYRGYIFEPANLAQQSFIAAINGENLTIDTMMDRYKKAQEFMKQTDKGIFYSFLNKDLENRLMYQLITEDFPLNEMDGEYKIPLLEEFEDRRKTFGDSESFNVMTNMYMRVVKPYALEVLGSYVRTFCGNLNNLKDKSMIYIYYVSPQRIAIAVRNDVTDDMLKEVFDEKFINNLIKIEKPELKDIVLGDYL